MSPKKFGRNLLCSILERQVRALRKRYGFTVVAVAGSVGKTSSKLAIAKVLASQKRVAYQEGNYNDRLTVPFVFFGHKTPASLYDVVAWLKIILRNQRMIRRGYPYDIVVVELGTDGPGQIAEFAYLQPEIAVVTAVSPEHMEFFGTLDAVAHEELGVAVFSKQLLYNRDDIDEQYVAGIQAITYGLSSESTYSASYKLRDDLSGERITFHINGEDYATDTAFIGEQGIKAGLCALAVADMLGLDVETGLEAIRGITPFAGRMQVLAGKHGAKLIDDTYNASPIAVKAALDVLYRTKASQRIAILGAMNELGTTSRAAHEEIGAYCDPQKLDAVATIGKDANEFLAPVARERGCTVTEFVSPYDAGEWVAKKLTAGTVVLAKGSQNRVFAEEALKSLLAHANDESKLVRQSDHWLRIKRKQFLR